MTKKIVALDAGHGGTDPGAVGNGLREKDITRLIVSHAKGIFDDHYPEVDCRLTRIDDQTTSLSQRTQDANAWGADCFVSVHVNSAANDAANGFESFRYTTDGSTSKSFALQQQLHGRLAPLWEVEKRANRGIKRANFHVLREFRGASVLLEHGFIVNNKDADLLSNSAFIMQQAHAIVEGIASYLGVSKQADTPSKKPDGLYRVSVDGTQVGAYGVSDNIINQVERALASGKRSIHVEKV